MKHIVSFSGGKDSTAMLLMMVEKGMPIDEIIFCDTGMEFDEIYPHIDKVKQYTGLDITVLKENRSFEYLMFEYQCKKGKNQDRRGLGWPIPLIRWCTGMLKRDVSLRYLNNKKPYTLYIGYAIDEQERIFRGKDFHRYPLNEWGITEKQALQYCYSKGFTWGGLYEKYDRVSCWCCPLQSIKDLRHLYIYYPDKFARLQEMDNSSWNTFRQDYTLGQLKQRFDNEIEREKNQVNIFDVLEGQVR